MAKKKEADKKGKRKAFKKKERRPCTRASPISGRASTTPWSRSPTKREISYAGQAPGLWDSKVPARVRPSLLSKRLNLRPTPRARSDVSSSTCGSRDLARGVNPRYVLSRRLE